MFVVKGGTKKRADCLANECTAKSVWVNCPVCHNKTKTKIYQDTLALRFPMYCPKCKKEMRVDIIRRKIYPCTKVYKYQQGPLFMQLKSGPSVKEVKK